MIRTLAAILILALPVIVHAEPPCHPTTDINDQERTKLKHRDSSSDTPTNATVAQMLKWGFPPHLDQSAIRLSEDPIDAREGNVYKISGRIWRVGREANDCDYHLELGALNKASAYDRVIVEIPQESHHARKDLLDLLPAKTRSSLLNAKDGKDIRIDIAAGPKVTVTGLSYYDGAHYSPNWKTNAPGNCNYNANQRHKRGNKHGSCAVGTIWELHPVWEIASVP